MDFLVSARDCLREISIDDLKVVNYKLVDLDQYNEAKIPCDCLDVVAVGDGVGQSTRPLVQDNSLNSLINYDTSGNRITYNQTSYAANPRNNYLIGYEGYLRGSSGWAYSSFDDYGEYLGKWFGYNPSYYDTFKVITERGVIKVNEYLSLNNNQAVMQYIGDGTDCNAATSVDVNASMTIQSYIEWYKDYKGQAETPGERKYLKQRAILRGRKSDITLDGMRRSSKQGFNY